MFTAAYTCVLTEYSIERAIVVFPTRLLYLVSCQPPFFMSSHLRKSEFRGVAQWGSILAMKTGGQGLCFHEMPHTNRVFSSPCRRRSLSIEDVKYCYLLILEDFLEEHHRVLESRLGAISREITDNRACAREELESLYRKIVSYVLLRSGLGSPTDIKIVREATGKKQERSIP